ncbi:MAG: hypothetical protein ACRC14_11885 [Paracoccaceae bacterium]
MVDVTGGVTQSEVEVEPIVPEVADAPDTVKVVTTAKGTLGIGGIVPIGTEATIAIQAFSATWMRPKTIGDRNKLVAAGKLPKPEPKAKKPD